MVGRHQILGLEVVKDRALQVGLAAHRCIRTWGFLQSTKNAHASKHPFQHPASVSCAYVDVTPAIWQPGYRVTDILGPPAPLSGGQGYSFTTTVVNGGDPDSLRVTWRVIRSYAPSDTQVVANTPNQLSLFVGEGSYSLRLIATPRDLVSDSTGGAFTRDYPVCTGQVPFGGGSSTNRPQGCGQPPIE